MKELSIEHKAKAYDKAFERAKGLYAKGAPDSLYLEEMFPELKESEDEKIRKALIEACKQSLIVGGFHKNKVIAWLEKQSGQETNDDEDILQRFSFYSYKDEPNILYLSGLYVNEECRNKGIGTKILEVANEVAKSMNCRAIRLKTKKGSNAERLYRTHGYNSLVTEKRDEIWLEKQVEQKSIVEIKSPEESLGISSKEYNEIVNDCLYGESESADKVEPKFKVCDWVIDKQGIVHQISNVIENVTNHTYCYNIVGGGYFNDNTEGVRLWTIQDAKDGDILCTYECSKPKIVFILKGTPKKHYALSYHCYYNIMYPHFTSDSEKGCLAPNDEDIKPATKEQCDLLFQKMKEIDYEWDAEKKELKKIVEEVDGEDYGIDGLWHAQRILEKTFGKVDGYQSDDGILEHECAFTAVKKLYEQKPTKWSEEDEAKRNVLIGLVEEIKNQPLKRLEDWDGYISWLKSLKDRVDSQQKQEWSEEDEIRLTNIIIMLKEGASHHFIKDDIIKAVDWLKSLRHQWKPSEEQLKSLQEIIDVGHYTSYPNALETLYEQLKQL